VQLTVLGGCGISPQGIDRTLDLDATAGSVEALPEDGVAVSWTARDPWVSLWAMRSRRAVWDGCARVGPAARRRGDRDDDDADLHPTIVLSSRGDCAAAIFTTLQPGGTDRCLPAMLPVPARVLRRAAPRVRRPAGGLRHPRRCGLLARMHDQLVAARAVAEVLVDLATKPGPARSRRWRSPARGRDAWSRSACAARRRRGHSAKVERVTDPAGPTTAK
jgi:hypothetical protein